MNGVVKRTIRVREAIGETRYGVIEAGKLVEVHVERWNMAGRPQAGDVWTVRVRRLDAGMGAAFVDMGTEVDGFLRYTTSPGMPRLTEGALLDVKVSREGEPGKGPILIYAGRASGDAPGVVSAMDARQRLAVRFPEAVFEAGRVPKVSDLVETHLSIPGGGDIAIEPTRALVAVDVDKGSHVSGLKVALAAAPLVAHQLRLRGLGGLICIDFPNVRQARQRKAVEAAVESAFANDPDKPKIAALSRFGVVEMTRSRRAMSLDRLLATTPLETRALEALETLLAEGEARRGDRLTLTVSPDVLAWLEATDLDWGAELTERLGARFAVVSGEALGVSA